MMFMAIVALLGGYLFWWEWRYQPGMVEVDPRPIEAIYRFNHWLPRLLMWLDGSLKVETRNRAVTLPHPWTRAAVVYVARHYIRAAHRAHEVAGHGAQIVRMGPVDYWCTYVWHYVLRRGQWGEHMMEREAQEAEQRWASHYRDLGEP
jgi:hypothetical protein